MYKLHPVLYDDPDPGKGTLALVRDAASTAGAVSGRARWDWLHTYCSASSVCFTPGGSLDTVNFPVSNPMLPTLIALGLILIWYICIYYLFLYLPVTRTFYLTRYLVCHCRMRTVHPRSSLGTGGTAQNLLFLPQLFRPSFFQS